MIGREELLMWLFTIKHGGSVSVDDGGLTLVSDECNTCIEVGGVPIEEEDPEESGRAGPLKLSPEQIRSVMKCMVNELSGGFDYLQLTAEAYLNGGLLLKQDPVLMGFLQVLAQRMKSAKETLHQIMERQSQDETKA